MWAKVHATCVFEALSGREDAVPMTAETCGAYLHLLELGGGAETAPTELFRLLFEAFSALLYYALYIIYVIYISYHLISYMKGY